jgi:hypothetical protein
MVQLPIALAVEPRLLPYAEANGFHMDTKVVLLVTEYVTNTEEIR